MVTSLCDKIPLQSKTQCRIFGRWEIHMYENIRARLAGLVIFKNLKNDPVIGELDKYFRSADGEDAVLAAEHYSKFANGILEVGTDLSEYLYRRILTDDNLFIRRYFRGTAEPLADQLRYELEFIKELADSIPAEPIPGVRFPAVASSEIDFFGEYVKALPDAHKRGVGVFAESSMFRVDQGGNFVPAEAAGTQRLSELVGYERERRRIVENTQVLMAGGVAANALLYGDAGTGKSSTVKAITAEYAADGLRLIELQPSQVSLIPQILERIKGEPLKFIIFIDDLTLSPDSAELSTLKTVLEGGAGTDRTNSVIYVTSNHRHLVKETAADRTGEINVQDNLQGVHGLSARFGLTVTFLVPDRELYLSIVTKLAEEKDVPVTDALLSGAEAFAIRRNGRTPRCARQYVELVASGIDPIK